MADDYIRWVPGVRSMKAIGRLHTWLYRATRGRIGARADGLDMLLLTTRGRKSGTLRTTPLPYFQDGDDLLLIASFGGNPKNPAWFGNLVHEPKVGVQVGPRRGEVEAHPATGAERERLWQAVTAEHPRYVEYQQRTERPIPVVVLTGAARL